MNEYLIFNLIIAIMPWLSAWFYPKSKWPNFRAMLAAITVVAIPFVVADSWVSGWWWDFNSQYAGNIRIAGLPIGELLFFVTVPAASLLLWVNFGEIFSKKINFKIRYSWVILLLPMIVFCFYRGWVYSGAVLIVAAGVKVWFLIKEKELLCLKSFWIMLAVTAGLISVFNGYLTARPVVVYNPEVKSNLMAGTIPFEDYVYGLILVAANVAVYEKLVKKS